MEKLAGWIFNPSNILIVPILIIAYVLLTSTDTIIEKLGFETRASLKAELTQERNKNQALLDENKELKGKIEDSKIKCKLAEEANNSLIDLNGELDKLIKDLIEQNNKPIIDVDTVIHDFLEKKEKETTGSDKNIVSIHLAYNQIFGA